MSTCRAVWPPQETLMTVQYAVTFEFESRLAAHPV